MRRHLQLLVALLLVSAQAPAGNSVVAEAGGAKMTAADARNLLAAAAPDVRAKLASDPSLLDRLVRRQMVQMLLLQEAHAQQWDTRPDVVFQAQQAHDAAIADSYLASLAQPPAGYPSDADVEAAYEARKDRLIMPRQYHLAQIFVALPPNATAAAEARAKQRLAAIRQQLAKPRADFAAVARNESDDKASAAAGGDLGWLPEDRLRPPVRDAVAGMQGGAVSEPLRTADGWHLIRLIGTKAAAPAPLADVRAQLVQALRQQRIAATERKLIGDLLRRQPIRVDEIGLQGAVKP
ncbi:MAG TPA: peptidylprolyl isomerase [Acetobacteraceae bacterium]|nr:peptidylprolyl isomerase [Acetobacteraceae bacterium]